MIKIFHNYPSLSLGFVNTNSTENKHKVRRMISQLFQKDVYIQFNKLNYCVDAAVSIPDFRNLSNVVTVGNWQQERMTGDVLLNDTP